MEVILKFIYGVLETLPEERLQALVLATDRLQVWVSKVNFMVNAITAVKRTRPEPLARAYSTVKQGCICAYASGDRRMESMGYIPLPDSLILCAQVKQLLERCVTQLKLRLTLDNFAETAVTADRLHHDGLHDGLVDFAQQEKNRCAHHACLLSCFACTVTQQRQSGALL